MMINDGAKSIPSNLVHSLMRHINISALTYFVNENWSPRRNIIRILAKFGADSYNGLMRLALNCENVDAVKVLLSLDAKLPGENAANNHEPITRNGKFCQKCGKFLERRTDYCPSCRYVFTISERY